MVHIKPISDNYHHIINFSYGGGCIKRFKIFLGGNFNSSSSKKTTNVGNFHLFTVIKYLIVDFFKNYCLDFVFLHSLGDILLKNSLEIDKIPRMNYN